MLMQSSASISAEPVKSYTYEVNVCAPNVSCDRCIDKSPTTATFVVSPKSGVVMLTYGVASGGKSTWALSSCKIVDESNWACGRESWRDPGYSMSQGILGYATGSLGRLPNTSSQRYCYFASGFFGRRLALDVVD
jgi:hypothetical protein